MGASAARTISAGGEKVIGFDSARDACETLRKDGIAVAANVVSVFKDAPVVLISLPRAANVGAVLREATEDGGLCGNVIADLSTVSPGESRELASLAKTHGAHYLDAPVLGRPTTCGHWTLTVGGSDEALQHAEPILKNVATSVVLVGDNGAGSAFKLLNNLMVGAINAATGEILASCQAVGIEPDVFVRTVASSGAASVSNLFLELAPRIVSGDFAPTFSLDLLHKDNRLALEMFQEAGIESLIGSTVQNVNDRSLKLGYGEKDLSAVTLMFEKLNGRSQ